MPNTLLSYRRVKLTIQNKICLVSCSVLKRELQQLVKQGLDAELVFVSKNFHVDYNALESNLRKVLDYTEKRFEGKIVLVYGDLCLGQDDEMKKLAKDYGVVKVDAVNCIDCQLGGKGKFFDADPNHNLMFMGPGMIDFFRDGKEKFAKEGLDEATYKKMFSGIKGVVLLDTCGDGEKLEAELAKLDMGLCLLETRPVGLEGLKKVLNEAIKKQ
jgi:hypothetical protein